MNILNAKVQVPCQMLYDDVWHYKNGLIKVSKDGLWGFIDEYGSTVVPIEYDSAEQSENGFICAEKQGQFGLLDSTGKIIIPFDYDEEFFFCSKSIWARKNGKFHLLNPNGEHITTDVLDEIWSGWNDLSSVRVSGTWGVICEISGKLVVPLVYQQAYPISGQLIKVKQNGKWGLLDHNGSEILPTIYTTINESDDGVICVKENGRWGIIKLSPYEG